MERNVLYIFMSILQIPLFTGIVAILELLGIGLFRLCGICKGEVFGTNEPISFLVLMTAQMLAFCVVQMIFYFQKKWNCHEALWKSRMSFISVCIGCFGGMILVWANMLELSALTYGQILVLLMVSVLNMLGYILYFVSKEKSRLETERHVYQKQSVLYQEWYEGFQKTRRETLAFRHDMNNHFGVLKYLCQNSTDKTQNGGRLSEIDKYIDRLGIQFTNAGGDTDTGNMMVDFAVDMKKNYAQSKGIPMEVELQIPREMNYSSMDLVIFLSNLLDNAIEACEKMEQRENAKIILKMQYKMSNLIVLIKNTYDGMLDGESSDSGEYAMIPTTKEDKDAHGIGMKNVMDIVEKYHGSLQWNAEQGWFTIHALLYDFDGEAMN